MPAPAPDNTQTWILTAVGTVLLTICGFGLKLAVSLVLKRLDMIVKELQALQLSRATSSQDIRHLQDQVGDHEERIRKVEYKHIVEKL